MDFFELTLKTFDGHNINDTTNYIGKGIPVGTPVLADSSPAFTERVDNFPIDGGIRLTGRDLTINIIIKAGTLSQLTSWFDTSMTTTRVLVVTDGSAVDWYVYARPRKFAVSAGEQPTARITLFVPDPVWRSVTVQSDTKNATASGQTTTLAIGGNKFARPKIVVGPTSSRTGGFAYKRFIAIANRVNRIYEDAINLPDSNWDTAALTTAKMQALGEDCRVFNDETGTEEYRWFGGAGIDTTTTRVFSNVIMPPELNGTLSGTIASSGAVATITLKNTKANKTFLRKLKQVGYKFVNIDMGTADTERFSFTSVNVNALQITGCVRAQKNTSMAAHADGAVIRHIKGYYIMYGNSSMTAPTVDDAYKPIYNLTSSTNTSHVYADFFDINNPNRLGQWEKIVLRNVGLLSRLYTATQDTFADVASVIGIAIKQYYEGTTPLSPKVAMGWSLYHPAGITTLTWTGNKYRFSTSWPAKTAMQKSNTGEDDDWADIANEATPASSGSYGALSSHSSVSLSGTYLNIRNFIQGSISAVASNLIALEITDLTATLDSSNTPLIEFASEETNNYEEIRVTNNTNGQWVEVAQEIPVNQTVTIDCDNLEAYTSQGVPVAIRLDDESRSEWMQLGTDSSDVFTGAAVLQIDETGLNAATMVTTWQNRNL